MLVIPVNRGVTCIAVYASAVCQPRANWTRRTILGTVSRSIPQRYDDAANHLVSSTDSASHMTRYTYDGAGQLSSVSDPSDNTTSHMRMLGLGSTSGSHGHTSSYMHDSMDRLEKVTDPLATR